MSSDDRDEHSWQQWLVRHGPGLMLLARQHCGSRADAQDAVQDGFVRFWKTRSRANDATAYLFACVRTAALDLSRGRRRRAHYEAALTPPPSDHLFVSLEDDELRQAVESALTTLPAEQREVIVLKIWGELTFAQIGEALAISSDTAASRYRYGLARLHAALQAEAAHE